MGWTSPRSHDQLGQAVRGLTEPVTNAPAWVVGQIVTGGIDPVALPLQTRLRSSRKAAFSTPRWWRRFPPLEG